MPKLTYDDNPAKNYLIALHDELLLGPVRKENGDIDGQETFVLMWTAAAAIRSLVEALREGWMEADEAEEQLSTALDRIVELEGRLTRGYGQ